MTSFNDKKTGNIPVGSEYAVFDVMSVAALHVAPTGQCRHSNHAWQKTIRSRPESPSDLWYESINLKDREIVVEAWKAGCLRKMGWSREIRFESADGELRQGRLAVNPIAGSADWVIEIQDVTESRQAETEYQAFALQFETAKDAYERDAARLASLVEELAAAKKQGEVAVRSKGEFLANMSHEIRTPMTAILGYVDILIDENGESDRNLSLLNVIKRNGEFLLEVINDILDISKIDAGKMLIEPIHCSPREIVNEVVALMSVRSEAKHLALRTLFDGEIPAIVTSDPTRLRQILMNLIGNAVKFTHEGEVVVTTSFTAAPGKSDGRGTLQFSVTDTGIGMSADKLKGLFDAFSQADASVTRKYGGTGLGLTISNRLVKLLGGEMEVQSEEGVGSVFSFSIDVRLPQTESTASTEPSRSAVMSENLAVVEDNCLKGRRILLAEDGPDNQRLITFLLKKAGAIVSIADNGEIACERQRQTRNSPQPFDLILMDMQMPVLDGYRATARLRQEGDTTPIIALTAHAMSGDRQKCLKAGCNDFAVKPLDRQALFRAILENLATKVENQ